jgi:hypothetical protein
MDQVRPAEPQYLELPEIAHAFPDIVPKLLWLQFSSRISWTWILHSFSLERIGYLLLC